MVQDEKLEGLIDDKTSVEVRMGVISVIMILEEVIGHKQRVALLNYASDRRKQSRNKNKDKALDISEVNRMFGWAIFHLRFQKIKK